MTTTTLKQSSQSQTANQDFGTIKALMRNILPFLILCYIVQFIDRVNIGFAASHMNKDLGLSATVYGFGAGIFAIGYLLFEVPSNLILARIGARIWIARILITWGLVSACFAFVQGETSFVILRFLLGVAEAGFFPGILLYLSNWFPRRAIARANTTVILGLPVAVLIGAPLSSWLISVSHGMFNITGWRWMFLIEGGAAVVIGVIAYFKLTDDMDGARFLNADQKAWLRQKIDSEREIRERIRTYTVLESLTNPKVLILAFAILLNITSLFGITMWMPLVIQEIGHLSAAKSNLMTALPYLCAGVVMFLNSRHSDMVGERRFHILIPAIIGGLGFVLTVATGSTVVSIIGLCLAATGILSSNVLFWGVPSMFLSGAAAAAGIALVNSIGNLGGFVGPYITGVAKDAFGTQVAGMYILAGFVISYGILMFIYLSVQARKDVMTASSAGLSGSIAPEL